MNFKIFKISLMSGEIGCSPLHPSKSSLLASFEDRDLFSTSRNRLREHIAHQRWEDAELFAQEAVSRITNPSLKGELNEVLLLTRFMLDQRGKLDIPARLGGSRSLLLVSAMAKIRYDNEDYAHAATLCSSETDKVNLGSIHFMTHDFAEAIKYYAGVIEGATSLLDVQPDIVASYCVSLVMVNRNSDAEDIVSKLDKIGPHHSRCVNAALGQLYCAKGNFEFGLRRIMHANDLCTHWNCLKTCVLGYIAGVSEGLYFPVEDFVYELVAYLENTMTKEHFLQEAHLLRKLLLFVFNTPV